MAGRVFDLDLLEAIGEAEGDRLVSAIEEAEGARLIIPTSGGLEARWGFANELFRQTLVSSLSSFRRRRLHVRIADALGRVYANALEKRAADLAHHLYQAGAAADPSKTVRYLKLAGDHACTIYANEDVARHYQWALETLGAGQDLGVDPLELREQLSDLLAPMGPPQRGPAALRVAAGIASSDRRSAGTGAPASQDRGASLGRRRSQPGAQWLAGLALLEGHSEDIELAHLYQEMGQLAYLLRNLEYAIQRGQGCGHALVAILRVGERMDRVSSKRFPSHALTGAARTARLGT